MHIFHHIKYKLIDSYPLKILSKSRSLYLHVIKYLNDER